MIKVTKLVEEKLKKALDDGLIKNLRIPEDYGEMAKRFTLIIKKYLRND